MFAFLPISRLTIGAFFTYIYTPSLSTPCLYLFFLFAPLKINNAVFFNTIDYSLYVTVDFECIAFYSLADSIVPILHLNETLNVL
jgi:hypothetical protein